MKGGLLLIGLFLNFISFSQKVVNQPTSKPNPVKLTTPADSVQYTLGAFIGLWITTNGFVVNNPPLFIRGMDDIFQNRPRIIPDSVVSQRIAAYQQLAQREKAGELEKQLFASLKDKPGVGMFPNGVRYVILKTGKGPRPADTDSILVNLIAKLPDGTVVEDTYKAGTPFATKPTAFFPGLNEALQFMSEGSTWQLYIPSVLAYGDKGTTLIPPNSALIIEVELVKVKENK
jgi:FKBP-type peptidyl-prolyl cis-trans isomerase FklB